MLRLLTYLASLSLFCVIAQAQQYEVLHAFPAFSGDGRAPTGNLVFDQSGNLYGTTSAGGSSLSCQSDGCGTVFRLSLNADGSWTETVIYNFCASDPSCPDGTAPVGGLVFDTSGNLYGTASEGGVGPCPVLGRGCGTVFELSPLGNGSWAEKTLFQFCSDVANGPCPSGSFPTSGLALDPAGNIYGTTESGGSGHTLFGYTAGVVFELSPSAPFWKEKVLHNFCTLGNETSCPDGAEPTGVTLHNSGKIYGTTAYGGTVYSTGGTVYELSPHSGKWVETVLYSFPRDSNPQAPITFDQFGNLYGTLFSTGGYGGVFRQNSGGRDYKFLFDGMDGSNPASGIIVDPKTGDTYGTTTGIKANNGGNVFKLDPFGNETVLYSFCAQPGCSDGDEPMSLIEDVHGNLFGTTYGSGSAGDGVLFEITP